LNPRAVFLAEIGSAAALLPKKPQHLAKLRHTVATPAAIAATCGETTTCACNDMRLQYLQPPLGSKQL